MPELMPHQQEGVAWLGSTPRALLADDPGLGKTAQVLLAAVPPVLVVAPAMLAGTWQDERAKWRPDLAMTWVSYASLAVREGRKVLPMPRPEYRQRWGTVIFDECTALKNRKAKQTLAALRLVSDRTYLVTGTPVPNWAHELFVLLRMMHAPGDRDYTSYWRWIDEWFATWTPPYGAPGHREISGLRGGLSWDDFARGNDLHRTMLRRLRDDVLADLPALTESTITCTMGSEQRRVYAGLKRDYCAWVEEAGTEVLAMSDGGRYVKLAKATTGLSTLMDDPDLVKGNCKLDALSELLEERAGSPVVCFTHFRSSAVSCVKAGQRLGREVGIIMGGMPQTLRDANVRAFQAGRLDMLVGTLGSLSEGVTLTRADTCIFVERSWRPTQIDQAMRRLHRIGQTRPVTVLHLVTEDSLDQRIIALLARKEGEATAALTAAQLARLL